MTTTPAFIRIHSDILSVAEIRYLTLNSEKFHVTVNLRNSARESDKGYRRYFFYTAKEAEDCFDTIARYMSAHQMTAAPSRPTPPPQNVSTD